MTKLPDSKIQEWTREHIPYRLRAVDGLRWWCKHLQTGKNHRSISLTINGQDMPALVLTNSVTDAGLIACRFLLEFVGVRSKADEDSPTKYGLELFPPNRRRPADVWCERLGHDSVSPDDFTTDERYACGYTHKTASGGVAHPTDGPRGVALTWLVLCAEAVTHMIEHRIYHDRNPDTRSPLRRIK